MIDTHAHLDFPQFDEDREETISRSFQAGVKGIINVGVDLESSRKSIDLAKKFENVFASIGIHPDYFMKHETFDMEKIFEEMKNFTRRKKVVAIGETGLDYFRITPKIDNKGQGSKEIKEKQKIGFIRQIEIAQQKGLPVIAHCRDAWDDLFEILSMIQFSKSKKETKTTNGNSRDKIEDTKFVLHCYSGEKRDTEKFLKLPYVSFSFSGNITYPKPIVQAEKLEEAVRMIPLDRIMLDSDSPFLAPQKMRGKRNEPGYVGFIAEKIAIIKKISVKIIEKKTDENAQKFFGLECV